MTFSAINDQNYDTLPRKLGTMAQKLRIVDRALLRKITYREIGEIDMAFSPLSGNKSRTKALQGT